MPGILPIDCWGNILQLYGNDEKITSVQTFLFTTLETRRKLDRVYKFCKDSWAQLFKGRFALNPLSPNSAHNQFSPNDIHRLSWAKSMRINKMITKRKIFDLLSNSLNSFMKEMYGDQFGEFVCGYWGLKG